MKKIISFLAFAFFFTFNLSAQDGLKAGVHFGIPTGDLGEFTTFNFGVDIGYIHSIGEKFGVGGTIGYTHFVGDKTEILGISIEVPAIKYLPIAATGFFNITENIFASADLGYALNLNGDDEDGTVSSDASGFYYAPKVGYTTDMLEFYLYYKGIAIEDSSLGAVGVGAAYKF